MDLNLFKENIKNYIGLNLFLYKEEQLNRRLLTFFNRKQITNLEEYALRVKQSKEAREDFIDYITINVTEFFRNPELFKELYVILKDYPKNSPFQVWSAACSNGCEPYTLSIILKELGFTNFKILATDLDDVVLNKAKEGTYTMLEVQNIPPEYLSRYFIVQNDKYKVKEDIKRNVVFKQHDLLKDNYEKGFDLVLCRNVVIYFNNEAKNHIYKNIYASLKDNGLLFVGATESIYNYTDFNFKKHSSFIYQKK